MELKLGVDWIQKLGKKLVDIKGDREAEIERINAVLSIDPRRLAELYIEPNFQPFNPANAGDDDMDYEDMNFKVRSGKWLDDFLQREVRRDGRHVAFILSDAGMGKTSSLAMLSLTAVTDFWPNDTIFRLFKLGTKTKGQIEALPIPSRTVLLLDSLDEDPTAFGRIEERIVELLRSTQHFKKVIITCRTQFFPEMNRFQLDGGLIKIAGFTCKVIYLSLFDDEQVDQYLDKAFKGKIEEKMKAEALVPEMKSLRMRPMLLANIEDLIDREPGEGEWNAYRLHEALVDAWLNREERKGLVKAKELLKGCWAMAVHLQTSQGDQAVAAKKLEEILLECDTPEGIKGVKDFGGRSLLNKNSAGEYRFAHFSIQEFLVVQWMIANPARSGECCSEVRWTDELVNFLIAWMLEDSSVRLRGELAKAIEERTEWRSFSSVDFGPVDLVGVNLVGAALRGAYLQEADLRGANFQGAYLVRADLQEAYLQGANLVGAYLQGAYLQEADLQEADLQESDLQGINLQRADLQGANLVGANLREAYLQGAYLVGANLVGAYLQEADLQRANLMGANLREVNLQGANLVEVNLQRADLVVAKLQGAKLQDGDFQEADLQEADLQGAKLQRAYLVGANLQRANLREANLQGADLQEADLQRADLQAANLVGANLQRAKLQGAKVSDEQLQQVKGNYFRD